MCLLARGSSAPIWVVLGAVLTGSCDGLQPLRTVGRRAGVLQAGTLAAAAVPNRGCGLTGTVSGLGSGHWFIYAEVQDSNRQVLEAWLPAAADSIVTEVRPLYARPAAESRAQGMPSVPDCCLSASASCLPACAWPGERGLPRKRSASGLSDELFRTQQRPAEIIAGMSLGGDRPVTHTITPLRGTRPINPPT